MTPGATWITVPDFVLSPMVPNSTQRKLSALLLTIKLARSQAPLQQVLEPLHGVPHAKLPFDICEEVFDCCSWRRTDKGGHHF